MKQAKQVAYGFLAMASTISLFITFLWLLSLYLNPLLGVPVFLFLLVPFALNCKSFLQRLNEKTPIQTRVKQAKNFLMALPGVGIACWFFDVLSTIFVIDIAQAGTELNPLGWPYSAPAALAYYLPITFVGYYLLFKVKKKISFYAAVVISAVTLFMGARNFFASLNNFGLGVSTRYSHSPNQTVANLTILCLWSILVCILAVINIYFVRKRRSLKLTKS